MILWTIDVGWPHRVGDQNVSSSTQPRGVGATEHTSMLVSRDLSLNVSIVHTLYVMDVGLPQLVGLQSSSTFIQPFGTGLPAHICIVRRSVQIGNVARLPCCALTSASKSEGDGKLLV